MVGDVNQPNAFSVIGKAASMTTTATPRRSRLTMLTMLSGGAAKRRRSSSSTLLMTKASGWRSRRVDNSLPTLYQRGSQAIDSAPLGFTSGLVKNGGYELFNAQDLV